MYQLGREGLYPGVTWVGVCGAQREADVQSGLR